MRCKYCQSSNTIKYGTLTTEDGIVIQRYFCNDCNRKFVPNTLPSMQTPTDQISAAMGMYYRGMSLDGIQGQLKDQFGNEVSESTIYYWIVRFTKDAVDKSKNFTPEVGDVWIADETGIDVHGSKRDLWFWDIIDAKTRYLLASHISSTRTAEDAQALITKAVQRAGKYPRVIITDKLHAYIDGVDFAVGHNNVAHVRSKPFTTVDSTNQIERFHGTFKDRTKVVRAYKNVEAADLITQGWLIHYNFFKQHEALGNVPPAVGMGIPLPFHDWHDVVTKTAPISQISKPKPIINVLTPEQQQRQKLRLQIRAAVKKHAAKKKAKRIKKQSAAILMVTKK